MWMSNITHASHIGLPIPPVFVASLLCESFSLWGGMTACQCCPTATSWGGYPAEGVAGDLYQSLSLFEFYVTAAYETNVTFLTWTMLDRPCLALFSYCSRLLFWSLSQCSTQLLSTPVVLVVVSVFHSVIVHPCRFGRCLSVPLSYCSLLSFWSLSQWSTQLLFTCHSFHSVRARRNGTAPCGGE